VTRIRAGWHGVQILEGARDFSVLQNAQTGSEAYPPSYSLDTGGSFPLSKAAAA